MDYAEAFYLQFAGFLPKLCLSGLIYLGFWMGSHVLVDLALRAGRRTRLDITVVNLMARSLQVAVHIFGAVTALGTLGVDIRAMIAGLGLTGFALGLALKDVLSNLLAGVMILLYRPFRLGQRISMLGIEGTVTEIDLRYTTIETENARVMIPNSNILTSTITLSQAKPKRSPHGQDAEIAQKLYIA
jgi:small conductance mechanosensitive channel